MRHFASGDFWKAFGTLPPHVQEAARRSFDLLKANPSHPSLHLKQIGRLWSARVSLNHRALGVAANGDILWFWIGSHADYDQMIKRR